MQQTEKKMPWIWYVGLVLIGVALMATLVMAPVWHWFPVQVTEGVTVVAVTESGCIADAPTIGMPINIGHCNALPGDVVEATYNAPIKATSGYYERFNEVASRP